MEREKGDSSSFTNNWSNVCTTRVQRKYKLCCLDLNACDREERRQNDTAVRLCCLTDAVQPLCVLQFVFFLMCGVRTCVEEGGLLVDLLFRTRAHLSWERMSFCSRLGFGEEDRIETSIWGRMSNKWAGRGFQGRKEGVWRIQVDARRVAFRF